MILKMFKYTLWLQVLLISHGSRNFVTCDKKVRVVELANSWTLRNQNGTIEVKDLTIPSGVYSAISERYGDVLQSTNVDSMLWVAHDNWTYTTTFTINQADFDRVRSVNLTLFGIDTMARIRLNRVDVGLTNNMFVRYSFNVLPFLLPENMLEIEIISPIYSAQKIAHDLADDGIVDPPSCPPITSGVCHRNMLRKMQMSFGSLWTPAVPSMGITKAILLEYYEVAIMRDVDIALNKNKTHWILDMRIILSSDVGSKFFGELTFFAPELLNDPVIQTYNSINYKSPSVELTVAVRKDNITLWWPNGYGSQKLYPLFFSMRCWLDPNGPLPRTNSISEKSLKIGFRTIELVEDVDKFGRSFFFKVNDVPIFIKGANYFPVHILPEYAGNKHRIRLLLESAKNMHMNMIRVWGGGLYESDYFYNLADTLGLLVWQDMPFTAAAYPTTDEFLNNICKEVVQNAQRIAYHPSLAMIVTNDEIEWYLFESQMEVGFETERLVKEYKQLFMGTIVHELKEISRLDFNPRPGPMISTPSRGVVESKKSLMDPQNIDSGDVHFMPGLRDGWNTNIYPRGRFCSKYGFPSMPIMNSWIQSLDDSDLLSDVIKQRQLDPSTFDIMFSLIRRHLPLPSGDWEQNIESYIYLTQIGQAITMKAATELYRSERNDNHTMGAIYWHLNDVNVAASTSTIDYYGNYKLLYYWSKQFLAPISIIALLDTWNRAINVTVTREDTAEDRDPRIYEVTMNTYLWSQLYPQKTKRWQVILGANSLTREILPIESILVQPFNSTNCFLEFLLSEIENKAVISSTFVFLSEFTSAVGITKPEVALELSTRQYENRTNLCTTSYSITLFVRRPALFVYLEIIHPRLINYRFSENGFIQTDPVKTITLEYEHEEECLRLALANLRVRTLNDYLLADATKKAQIFYNETNVEKMN